MATLKTEYKAISPFKHCRKEDVIIEILEVEESKRKTSIAALDWAIESFQNMINKNTEQMNEVKAEREKLLIAVEKVKIPEKTKEEIEQEQKVKENKEFINSKLTK